MRALVIPAPGQLPTIDDVPVPAPASRSVLIRVHAAALNPSDWKLAFGLFPTHPDQPHPLTLGRDFVGVVEQVGSAVTEHTAGDWVCGMVPDRPLVHGSLAELTVVAVGPTLCAAPDAPPGELATLGVAGTTAVAAVDAVEPSNGDVVLVVGASGGVGSFAVQLLKTAGASVVAVGRPNDRDNLVGLGADHVVSRSDDWENLIGQGWPDGVAALIDLTDASTQFERRLRLVATGGRASSPLHPDPGSTEAQERNIAVQVANGGGENALARLTAMVTSGDVRPLAHRTVNLAQAVQTLADLRDGKITGKVVVDLAR